ncbi:translational activator of cytochrome c oxidase 1-like [Styela clava]
MVFIIKLTCQLVKAAVPSLLTQKVLFITAFQSGCFSSQIRALGMTNQCHGGKMFYDSFRRTKESGERAKAKLFSNLARRLEIAIREGGGNDPKKNKQLAAAIQECKKANMMKSSIDKALSARQASEEFSFALSGPGHSTYLIICGSTAKHNAKLAMLSAIKMLPQFSLVSDSQIQFDRKRIIITDIGHIKDNEITEEKATEIAIEIGAEDVEIVSDDQGSLLKFTCNESGHKTVEEAIETDLNELIIFQSKTEYVPNSYIDLEDRDLTTAKLFYQTLTKLDARIPQKFEFIDMFHNVNGLTTTSHI